MSTISAGTTTTTALVQTGDTTGSLVLKTGSTPTTAMTINSSQIVNFANAPTVAGAALPSGAMTLISTKTASSSASLAWTGLSGYDKYILLYENVSTSSSSDFLGLQVGTGSTPTYLTSGYISRLVYGLYNGASASTSTLGYNPPSGTNQFYIGGTVSTIDNTTNAFGNVNLFGITNGIGQGFTGTIYNSDTSNNYSVVAATGGYLANTSVVTALSISMNSGTTFNGKFSLYGISS